MLMAQPPVQVNPFEVSLHEISSVAFIRVPNPRSFEDVKFEVRVDLRGRVFEAKAVNGRSELYAQAETVIRLRQYKPFLRMGQPVEVSFDAWVSVLPPEIRPKTGRTFPEVKDWSSVRFGLVRTSCFGSCPAYEVEIRGDGSVLYKGERNVAVLGEHRGTISRQSLERLMTRFREADYFSLDAKYMLNASDGAAYTTSLSINGKTHSVIDYMGLQAGMPMLVDRLERDIDQYSGAEMWTRGNRDTVSTLRAEGFDFTSQEAGRVLTAVARRGDADAVRDLIRAGVPLSVPVVLRLGTGGPPLVTAVSNPDPEVLRLLIEAGASKDDPKTKSEAAKLAQRLGRQDILTMLLKYGARIEAK